MASPTGEAGDGSLGRRLITAQPNADGCQLHRGEEVLRRLVEASGDAAELFDLVEEAFDEVARLVEVL